MDYTVRSEMSRIEVEQSAGLKLATCRVNYIYTNQVREMVRVTFVAPYIDNRMFNNKYAPVRMILHGWDVSIEVTEPERFGDFGDEPRKWVEEFYSQHTNEEAPFNPVNIAANIEGSDK